MKKPSNRKERIDFFVNKLGIDYALNLVFLTDGQVAHLFNARYQELKKMPDYKSKPTESKCVRCESFIYWHSVCDCGEDRAVFDDDSWLQDIRDCDEDDNEPDWFKQKNLEFQARMGIK